MTPEEIYKIAESKTKDQLIYLLVTTIKDYEQKLTQQREEALKDFVGQLKVALKETEIKGKDATEDFAMDMVLTQMMPDMLDGWLDYYLTQQVVNKNDEVVKEVVNPEIAKWEKALKEATSLEGKLYARDRLRELKK